MQKLPTYEEIRVQTYRLLSDAADWLRSDWAEGAGPTSAQAAGKREAFQHITAAKDALNR